MARRLGFFLVVILCLGILPKTHAQIPEGMVVVITSPVPGQQLFGQYEIIGIATHTTAFDSYILEYDDLSQPALDWQPVQSRSISYTRRLRADSRRFT